MTPYLAVLTTTDSRENASRIANALITQRLAACVQITPIESTFVWDGKVATASELQLLIKSRATDYQAVEAAIKSVHAYSLPQITALPIVEGSAAYLAWIDSVTTR